MVYPIENWPNLKRGFLFKQIYPASFGVLAGCSHLGLDVIAPLGTPIRAWQDLKVINYQYGPQGGNTILVKCPNNIILFRLMHLLHPVKTGFYKEGSILCQVGDTGSACHGPHLHLDESKNGILDIHNINNFIDPEAYFKGLKYTA